MKIIVSKLLFVFFSVFCVNISFTQVVQEQANKIQLISGVKLEPSTSTKNLIKLKPTSVKVLMHNEDSLDISKKENKDRKPPKILKYGNRKTLNHIKKEDDE